jgi:hypothetical protein
MGKNGLLRRSRSWRDLSSLMSKRIFGGNDEVPVVPLKRSLSVGRVAAKERRPGTARTVQGIEREHFPSIEVQREKEREFQRRASIKRKAVPESGVFTNSPPQTTTQPSSHSAMNHQSQLPGFTFSTKALERSPGTESVVLPPFAPWNMRSQSDSMGGHSRMASEMSVPMILDFDLAKHQDSAQFSTAGGLDFGFSAEIVEKELTVEEKAEIISNISPMHVVNINTKKDAKPCRNNTLKRLFSRRKSDKPPTPPKYDSTYRLSSSKSSISSKKSYETSMTIPNFEANGSKTIYARPAKSTVPSHRNSIRKDAPPRLTVQIPDSTMDRASKIFQSIYMAHAQAQEALGPQQPTWVLPTPDSTPSTTTAIHRNKIRPVRESVITRLGFDHRPAPKPISTPPPSPTASPLTEMVRSLKAGEYSAGSSPLRIQSRERLVPRSAEVAAKRRGSRVTSGRWLSAFPIPPSVKGPPSPVVDLSDVDESEDSFDDWDGSNEEWDNDTLSSDGGKLKEPAWEMLTPPTKVVAV